MLLAFVRRRVTVTIVVLVAVLVAVAFCCSAASIGVAGQPGGGGDGFVSEFLERYRKGGFTVPFPGSSAPKDRMPRTAVDNASSPVVTITPADAGCNYSSPNGNYCAALIQGYLNDCPVSCILRFEGGSYYLFGPDGPGSFVGSFLTLPGSATSVEVRGQPNPNGSGAPLTRFVLGGVGGLFYSGSTSSALRFSHFAVDSIRMPYIYGVARTENTVFIPFQIPADPVFAIDPATYPWIGTVQAVNSYDESQQRWTGFLDSYGLSSPARVSYAAAGGGAYTLTFDDWPTNPSGLSNVLGQMVILRHQVYSYNTWSLLGIPSVTITDVDVYSGAGMGFYCGRCGSVQITSLRIDTPRAPWLEPNAAFRPVSINADGIHVVSQAASAAFVLTGSHIASQGDDGLNINSPMARISALSPDRRTVAAAGFSNTFPFQTGDTVNIIDGQTLQYKQSLPGIVASPSSLTFSSSTPASTANVGDLCFAASAMSNNVQITNNYFGRNRGRGMLIRAFHSYIVGNTFDRVSANAYLMVTDSCYFYEGLNVIDVNFSGNTIVAVNAGACANSGAVTVVGNIPSFSPDGQPVPGTCGDSVVPVNYNISIANNNFVHNVFMPGLPAMHTVWMSITDGVGVAGNTVTRDPGVPVPAYEIWGQNCVSTVAADNTCNGAPCSTSGL